MGCREGRLRLEMKDNFTRASSRCRAFTKVGSIHAVVGATEDIVVTVTVRACREGHDVGNSIAQ
jgi:hypothetical protein